MKIQRWLLLVTLLLVGTTSHADTMVLIHGYLGDIHSWESSGVAATLQQNGWQRAGFSVPHPNGHRFYSVNLPSEAPVSVQANYLRPILKQISRRHPGDRMILVGHSAGGVLARYMVVEQVVPNIDTLITIASPHIGTPRADQALDFANTGFPFSLFQWFFTNDLYHVSRSGAGLFVDLLAPRPGNLLYWLNGQTHPRVHYYSIIRRFSRGRGDQMVPSFSQDMNNVPALRGRSGTLVVDLPHTLHPIDGQNILSILRQIEQQGT